MKKEHFITRLMEMADINSKEEAEKGLRIVFSLLSHRLLPDEAKDVEAQLPEDLKSVWNAQVWAVYHASISNKTLKYRHLQELLSLVENEILREKLNINPEVLTKSVFHLLKDQISLGELRDIAAELPEEICDFFKAA